jgi:hypothetical protein
MKKENLFVLNHFHQVLFISGMMVRMKNIKKLTLKDFQMFGITEILLKLPTMVEL